METIDDASSPVLGYATPEQRRPPSLWLRRIAMACGYIPLGIGLTDMVLWIITRDDNFAVIGLYTLGSLPYLFGIGFIFAAVYAGLEAAVGVRLGRWLGRLGLVILLYVLTASAGIGCVILALAIEDGWR